MTNKQLKEIASASLRKIGVFAEPRIGRLRSNNDAVWITFNCVNVWVVKMSKIGEVHSVEMV